MPTWILENMVHKLCTTRNRAELEGENTIPNPLPGIQLTGAFTWLILSTLLDQNILVVAHLRYTPSKTGKRAPGYQHMLTSIIYL